MNWQTVKVGDLCNLVRGSSPRPKNDSRYYGGPVPRLMVADVTRDGFLVTPRIDSLTEAGAKLSRPVKAGTIVMAVSGNVGLMSRLAVDACIHDGFVGFVNLSEKVQPHYFMWLMTHLKGSLAQRTAGAIFQNTTTTAIKELEIPLPPLAEQERIAARLDAADRLRALRRDALARLDALTHSLFLEMFGDPAHNPMDWPVVNFEDVVFFQEGPGVRNWQFRDEGIKLVNVRNIVNGALTPENTDRHLDPAEVEKKYKHFLLDAGDYVLASSGVTWGKIAEVLPEHLPLCLNTSIIRLRPKNESIDRTYLRSFVLSSSFTRQIDRLITGSAQPNFGPSHLKQVLINVPPLSLQQRFASRLGQIERVRAQMERSRLELDALFASLQSAAFEAEPRVNEG